MAEPPSTARGSGPVWDMGSGSDYESAARGPAERMGLERIGDYEVQSEIARGGMGVVYRAIHPQLNRAVAIKVLHAGDRAGPKQIARFQTEARAAARLRHPNLVSIHDVGTDRGCPYIVLDLIEGGNLQELVDADTPMPQHQAAQVAAKLARALHYAHGQQVLHRDVKPLNVLLSAEGEPFLTDFGLAKQVDVDDEGVTVTGQFMGTPGYSPPEQVRGELNRIDARADVFALGATLHAMLTGAPPGGGGSSFRRLLAVLDEDLAAPSTLRADLDRDLETICLKCLAIDPEGRYASAEALAEDLDRYLKDEPIRARRPSTLERAQRWMQQNRTPLRAVLGAVVVMLGIAGVVVTVMRESTSAANLQKTEEDAALAGAEREKAAAESTREVLELLKRSSQERLSPEQRSDVVAGLKVHRTPATVAILTERLDGVTVQLLAVERELYMEAEQPKPDEARAGARPLEGLRAALDRRAQRAPGEAPSVEDQEVLAAADQRLVRRILRLRGQTSHLRPEALVRRTIASKQSERLPEGRLQLAEVLCRALGHLGLRRGAVLALGRYLDAEADGRRAAFAASGLCRLGGRTAQQLVFDSLERFGATFARGVERYLPFLADTPIEEGSATQLAGRARIRIAQGDLEGALRDCTQALELSPKDAGLFGARAVVYRRQRNWKAMEQDLAQAVALDPRNAALRVNHSDSLLRLGRPKQALEQVDRALELDPYHAGAWVGKGMIALSDRRFEEANSAFSQAIHVDPLNAEAWYQRGRARKAQENYTGAIDDYTRAIQLDPRFAKAWRNRGSAKRKVGDLSGAIEDTTRAMELDPSNPWAPTYRGVVRAKQGDLEGALADFNRAIAIDPDLARPYAERAGALLLRGDTQGALADADKAIALEPKSVMGHFSRANALKKLGRLEEAREAYGEAIAHDPRHSSAWSNRGLVRLELGDSDGALADCDKAIAIDARTFQAYNNRGLVKRSRGDLDGALADLSKAISLRPNYAAAYVNRAALRKARGDVPGALKDLTSAIQRDPNLAQAWLHRGAIRRAQKSSRDAIADCSRAIAIDPQLKLAWAVRGLSRADQGDRRAAIADLEQFMKLAPADHPQRAMIQSRLKELRR